MAASHPETIVRPLVLRFGALGDFILLTALLRGLRRVWGQPCDVVVPGRTAEAVFAGLDSVHELIEVGSRRTPYWLSRDQQRLVSRLRARGPSPIYVADRADRCQKVDWLLQRARIPRAYIVGPQDVERGDLEHVVHYFGRLARTCPAGLEHLPRREGTGEDPLPELRVSDEEVEECRHWLAAKGWEGEPLVVMQTQSRRQKRGRWGTENWVSTILEVLEVLPAGRVVLLGSAGERELVGQICESCWRRGAPQPRVWNVAGELQLRRLFALLSLCHSGISLDSGPAHAAAVMRCPIVVLIGQADPRRNLPPGSPELVQWVTAWPPEEWPGTRLEWEARHQVAEIPLEAVLDAWRRLHYRLDVGAT